MCVPTCLGLLGTSRIAFAALGRSFLRALEHVVPIRRRIELQ
jgi:hypothetical protein